MKPKLSTFLGCLGVFLFLWLCFWSAVLGFIYLHGDMQFASSANTDDFQVKFGIVGKDSDGNDTISEETTTIPMKFQETGFAYGLTITPPDDKPYTYHCTLHFPTAPKVMSGGFEGKTPSTTIVTDDRQVTGTVTEPYGFDHGDPLGPQSIDLTVNGKLVKTIKFTVVEDKGS
jgi:hypothetical protein